jgi:8-oxo-dGTP pyrophosphatase MutT (NUDIX family)
VITGVSAFVRWDNRLLLEVQKPHKWTTQEGQTRIGCGFIGGAIEAGESVMEALQREAREEIGCGLEVAEASGTTRICADQSIINRKLFDSAVFEWEARAAGYDFDGRVPVLSATPLASPTPIDLPALLVVDLDLFSQIGTRSGRRTRRTHRHPPRRSPLPRQLRPDVPHPLNLPSPILRRHLIPNLHHLIKIRSCCRSSILDFPFSIFYLNIFYLNIFTSK